jgi:hypothetical protein
LNEPEALVILSTTNVSFQVNQSNVTLAVALSNGAAFTIVDAIVIAIIAIIAINFFKLFILLKVKELK